MPELPVGDPTAPDLFREIAEMKKAIRTLERRNSPEQTIPRKTDTVVFSHANDLVSGTWSPPYIYRRPVGYLTEVKCGLTNPGSTHTIVVVGRMNPDGTNFVDIAEVTIPSGDYFTVDDDLMAELTDMDLLVVKVDIVGTGAKDISVTCTLMEGLD